MGTDVSAPRGFHRVSGVSDVSGFFSISHNPHFLSIFDLCAERRACARGDREKITDITDMTDGNHTLTPL